MEELIGLGSWMGKCVCFIPTSKVGPSSHTGLERDCCFPLGLSAMSGSKYI